MPDPSDEPNDQTPAEIDEDVARRAFDDQQDAARRAFARLLWEHRYYLLCAGFTREDAMWLVAFLQNGAMIDRWRLP